MHRPACNSDRNKLFQYAEMCVTHTHTVFFLKSIFFHRSKLNASMCLREKYVPSITDQSAA